MDPKTLELREAHDVLAEFYAERLVGALATMPVERAVLDLFCDLTVAAGIGVDVLDAGCGTGRLEPYLAAKGLRPTGMDLAPGMVAVAERDHPDFDFRVADLRQLPLDDASVAGVVGWYSLIFLPPAELGAALRELFRVLRPGGHLVVAYKSGDGAVRRAGRSTGLDVEFDCWWMSPATIHGLAEDAGFELLFWAGVPAEGPDSSAQGYVLARRPSTG